MQASPGTTSQHPIVRAALSAGRGGWAVRPGALDAVIARAMALPVGGSALDDEGETGAGRSSSEKFLSRWAARGTRPPARAAAAEPGDSTTDEPGDPADAPDEGEPAAPAAWPTDYPSMPVMVGRGDDERVGYERRGWVAVVRVEGALTFERAWYNKYIGLIAYADLVEVCRALEADPLTRGVVFSVQCPGGTVAGVEELVMAVRRLASVKPVVAVGQDEMCSAAYISFCQGQAVYAAPVGSVGCLGAIVPAVDTSEMYADMGVRMVVKTSFGGPLKGLGYPGTAITAAQEAALQREADQMGGWFLGRLMEARGIAEDVARGLMDGRIEVGKSAVEAGMADAVGSVDQVVDEMNQLVK